MTGSHQDFICKHWSNKLKKDSEYWLGINDKDFFKCLKVYKQETQLGKNRRMPKKKRKL